VAAQWHGSDALELTYKTLDGGLRQQVLFRADEAKLALSDAGTRRHVGVGPRGDILVVAMDEHRPPTGSTDANLGRFVVLGQRAGPSGVDGEPSGLGHERAGGLFRTAVTPMPVEYRTQKMVLSFKGQSSDDASCGRVNDGT
jgi:hypothetical protein